MLTAAKASPTPWRAIFAGLCASLIAIGLGRFAYTPLIPAQIDADWFSPSQTIYFGAANLGGYLAGAIAASLLPRRFVSAALLRAMMLLATVSFFACSVPLSGSWFFFWRFGAGVAGGFLMVLAAPMILPHVPPARRGLAAGAIFLGVGLGIVASGTAIPRLLRLGVADAWVGVGAAALILTALAWPAWPNGSPPAGGEASFKAEARDNRAVRALYLEYGLTAVGQVVHVIFLVDFIARGLGKGVETGSHYWIAFGIGAVIGPISAGIVADRIGFRGALRLSLVLQAAAAVLPTISTAPAALLISSIGIGAFIPGSVALTIGRVRELVPHDSATQAMVWGRCTAAFAIGQAIAAYGYSFIFANVGERYLLLFAIGATGFSVALLVDIVATAVGRTATVKASTTDDIRATR